MMDTSSRLQYDKVTLPVYDGEGVPDDLSFEADDICVVFVKIDNFGKICGTNDHPEGTRISGELINRLCELRPLECDAFRLPRVGFFFVMADRDREEIEEFTQRMANATKSPLDVDGKVLNVSLSIGVAQSVDTVEGRLLDRAQFAASSAAGESGSAYEFYDSTVADRITEEESLKNDLYEALDEDQFFLVFQPLVSLDDYSVIGAEALIRWEHPERGTISPGTFIPLAEKTGQILFLDRWVLRNAVEQAAEWSEHFGSSFQLGVNISAWQFRDDFLLDKISGILAESGYPPEQLTIEVTETSVMEDVQRTGRVLEGLKEQGIQVALDDFGTGHATFEYLSQFPIDELKIDRSFLNFDDVYTKNQELVDIMIQTGKRIGTSILAEGVETEDQLTFLRNRGCERAQGFLLARPQPPEEFQRILESDEPLYRKSG